MWQIKGAYWAAEGGCRGWQAQVFTGVLRLKGRNRGGKPKSAAFLVYT